MKKSSSLPEMYCNGKRCSWKFRKIHTPLPEPRFFDKVAVWTIATLLKRVSSTGDLLWILRISQEHLFYRKPLDELSWKWPRKIFGIFGKILAKCILQITHGDCILTEDLTSQLSWVAARLFVKLVCPVHLVYRFG